MARSANQSRVYLVKRGDESFLVRAPSRSAAVAHVMRDVSAEIAQQDQIIEALTTGKTVQEAEAIPAKPRKSKDEGAAGENASKPAQNAAAVAAQRPGGKKK